MASSLTLVQSGVCAMAGSRKASGSRNLMGMLLRQSGLLEIAGLDDGKRRWIDPFLGHRVHFGNRQARDLLFDSFGSLHRPAVARLIGEIRDKTPVLGAAQSLAGQQRLLCGLDLFGGESVPDNLGVFVLEGSLNLFAVLRRVNRGRGEAAVLFLRAGLE